MFTDNLILSTDSYKTAHWRAYDPGVQHLYSYVESRGGLFDRTVFFGLQMFLRDYLARPITAAMIEEADAFLAAHGEPFNRAGWEAILRDHGGRLPLSIRAVPEGTVVPTGNVLATVVNTDPRFPWLTSYVETALLRAIWYPTTVATLSWHIKRDLRAALERTCDDPEGQLLFRLHDFGARGASSAESAALGGVAHLVNFRGSDTIEGVLAARRHYGEPMAAFSIPAAEHSVICSWGPEGEAAAFGAMLDAFAGPGRLLAVVSDTYDLFHAVRDLWGGALRDRVASSGGTLVVRPDSGDPMTVPIETVALLAEAFGTTTNAKGFRVLAPCVRVIQGDGINRDSIGAILAGLEARGFSAENVAFGMGGALLQGVNRDTQRFAMKASAVSRDGVWSGIAKTPATDPAKASKRGRLALIHESGRYATVPAEGNGWRDLLVEVWRDGALRREWSFAEVRANADRAAPG